jgi:hypothetical protein
MQLLYFACRISMVLHIAFFALNLNTLYEIPCQGVIWVSKGACTHSCLRTLTRVHAVTDMTGTVSASAILALRSHAVWGRHRVVGAVLLAGLLAQLALWLTSKRPPAAPAPSSPRTQRSGTRARSGTRPAGSAASSRPRRTT